MDDLFKEFSDLLGPGSDKTKSVAQTADDRILENYNVVKTFYEKHGRLPEKSKDFTERSAYSKYSGLISDPNIVASLKEHDTLGLLKSKEYESLEEAFDDPELAALLTPGPLDLSLKHVKKYEPAEYVARSKKCVDFENYEYLFKKCNEDLKNGRREILPFAGTKIEHGKFYVVKGMMCYIANVGELTKDKKGNWDGRLHVVFDNKTESDLLLQSLRRSISIEKGFMITVPDEDTLDPSSVEDVISGSVYVLRSLIKHDVIQSFDHFYKIGFTKDSVGKRIANAEKEPTYLYAPVKLVAEYEVRNARAQGVEKLLHKFFAGANVDIEVNGCNPKEWFKVPLDVIDQAINLVISGQIIYYKYNSMNTNIELK